MHVTYGTPQRKKKTLLDNIKNSRTQSFPVLEEIKPIGDGHVPDFSLFVEAQQLFRRRSPAHTGGPLCTPQRQALTASTAVNVTLMLAPLNGKMRAGEETI